MATDVFIAESQTRAKIRNPWGVLGLSIITFGIYGIFWWYYINRELRDLGRAKGVAGLGDNPTLSTIAYVLGGFALAIPTIWTLVTTTRRAQHGQRAQGHQPFSGWLAALVYIGTLGIGTAVFLQYAMNRIWEEATVAPPPGVAAGPAGAQADIEGFSGLDPQELPENATAAPEPPSPPEPPDRA